MSFPSYKKLVMSLSLQMSEELTTKLEAVQHELALVRLEKDEYAKEVICVYFMEYIDLYILDFVNCIDYGVERTK